ncbi:hypothetical protein ACVWXN_010706 [Bradyrhizobium sp. i1.4.4]
MGLRIARDGLRLLRRGMRHARAGLHPAHHHKTDQQADGRHRLEIGKGLEADAAHRLHVADLRDAGDHHQEDQRRDRHLDQRDEGIAERLEFDGDGRKQESEQCAERGAGDDEDILLAPERLAAAFGNRARHRLSRYGLRQRRCGDLQFASSNGIVAPCEGGALFLSCDAVYIGPAACQALMPYRYDLRTKPHHGPGLAGGFPCHR